MHLSSVDADKCICAAGDIQAPEAQEASKGEAAEKTVSPADRQALLQFLRMMRKGKVRPRPGSCVPSCTRAAQDVAGRSHMQRLTGLCGG